MSGRVGEGYHLTNPTETFMTRTSECEGERGGMGRGTPERRGTSQEDDDKKKRAGQLPTLAPGRDASHIENSAGRMVGWVGELAWGWCNPGISGTGQNCRGIRHPGPSWPGTPIELSPCTRDLFWVDNAACEGGILGRGRDVVETRTPVIATKLAGRGNIPQSTGYHGTYKQ